MLKINERFCEKIIQGIANFPFLNQKITNRCMSTNSLTTIAIYKSGTMVHTVHDIHDMTLNDINSEPEKAIRETILYLSSIFICLKAI